MVFDEVIFDQVLNPRYVAFCLKMEKKSPEGKKNERKKDIQEDNKNDIHRKHFDSVTER
jgi:hypothetical protein